jgi:hypothetical protein
MLCKYLEFTTKIFNKLNPMSKTQTIKRKDLSEIYGKVCDGWKLKIANILVEQPEGSSLEIPTSLVKEAYSAANADQKKLVEKYFDITSGNSFAKITGYSDVCKALNEDEIKESDFKFLPKERRKKACAQAKFQQVQALSWGDEKLDWKNQNQKKYYNYFDLNGQGGLGSCCVFYYCDCFFDRSSFYRTEEDAKVAQKLFKSLYEDLM